MQTTLDDYCSTTRSDRNRQHRGAQMAIGLATISLLIAIVFSNGIAIHAAPSATSHAPHVARTPVSTHGSFSPNVTRTEEDLTIRADEEAYRDPEGAL